MTELIVTRALDPTTREIALEVVRGDPELRARVATLVTRAIDLTEEFLDTAPDPTRLAIIRSIIPATMRELREEQKDQSLEALREEIRLLHADIRESINVQDVESWEEEVVLEVDTPPAPEPTS